VTDHLVIESERLTTRYGAIAAVDALDLRVARHRITGFVGRNGSGKSSTIKMLLGMIAPTSGRARVLGHAIDVPDESVRMRRRIAYVGEEKGLYPYMTVAELVRFTRSFYDDWQPALERELLAAFELPLSRRVKALSRGMRTKLALLLALARRAELLILDEPAEGLDPVLIEELLQRLVRCGAEGTTVFFSSHQLADVERIADDVVMIDRGRVVLAAALDEVRERYRTITLGFTSAPDPGSLHMPGVDRVVVRGRHATLHASARVDSIVRSARSIGAVSVDVAPLTLRELFLDRARAEP
jgi:ABC-2 type transport system ATP-binding protein